MPNIKKSLKKSKIKCQSLKLIASKHKDLKLGKGWVKYYIYYSPFDVLEDLYYKAKSDTDIEFWDSMPEFMITVVLDTGEKLNMRIKPEDGSMEKWGCPQYWFAFDNDEYAEFGDEFDFIDHVVKWKFAD